jgi:tripartite-type tricarboxylate transporter receptor subunit TctC
MHAVWLLGVYVLILVIGIVLVVATGLLVLDRHYPPMSVPVSIFLYFAVFFLRMETCSPSDGTAASVIQVTQMGASMTLFRKFCIATGTAALACSGLLFQASGAVAQSWPTRTVTIVVPFGAGSITDSMARVLADKLGTMWKQSVVVENRPGLPGTTGVAKSAPDGYTLMLTSNGHTIAGVVNKGIQFDPVKDFAGVTVIASVPLVAIVPKDFPAKTLKEFVALATEQPGKLNFSSAGVASTSFLSAEIFRQGARINMVHVPYKGVPDATNAVIRGDVQMYFAPIPNAKELSEAGKVRAIAINSGKRAPPAPECPDDRGGGGAGLHL